MSELLRRLRIQFRRNRFDRELRQEMQFHLRKPSSVGSAQTRARTAWWQISLAFAVDLGTRKLSP